MNSGRFDPVKGRIRPGTYINVDASGKAAVKFGSRGFVLVPLIGHNWGPDGKIVTIKATDITAHDAELGAGVTDILLVNEALKGAGTVLVYFINKGTAASMTEGALTVTALYGGTRGNDIKISSNAETDGTYTISVMLGTETVETFSVASVDEAAAISSKYVKFSGTGALTDFIGVSLKNGTDGAVTRADVAKMLDSIEDETVSAICFPVEDDDLKAVAVSKVKYLRENCGKTIQAVVADYDLADYEGVINVCNSYARTDGVELTHAQATAYVAAITASATETVSNTYKVVAGADTVVDKLTNEQTEEAILAGKFVFTQDGDNVIVEYDINSLHTFTETRSEVYRKNKVIRVFDAVSDTIRETFPPNRFPNSTLGWDLMDGLCQTILQYFLDEDAIKDVDISNDLKVNRAKCSGDSVFFDGALHPVDAAEKLYFSIITD